MTIQLCQASQRIMRFGDKRKTGVASLMQARIEETVQFRLVANFTVLPCGFQAGTVGEPS